METGLIFHCQSNDSQIRVDIGSDVTISFDEITTPLCDARCIEIPIDDWPALAEAIEALLSRREVDALAAESNRGEV